MTVVCDCVLQDSGHGAHAHPEGAGARPNTSPLTPSSIAAEMDAPREALDACDAVPLLAVRARWRCHCLAMRQGGAWPEEAEPDRELLPVLGPSHGAARASASAGGEDV